MLTLPGKPYRLCDHISRRSFLRNRRPGPGRPVAAAVLRAQAQSGVNGSHKAVIMVFLSGGPPHQDMVDLKPDAPAEIRGEFKPIRTNVPGIDLCEHLPRPSPPEPTGWRSFARWSARRDNTRPSSA